jgi:TRAP-type C4-dicarboxylate transport system permease small subunit
MDILDRITRFLNRILIWIAGLSMVAMVLLTCSDVLLRLVWVPIRGSVELVAYFSAIVTAFALGYTQMRRGHTSVDVVVNLFPDRVKRALGGINSLICMVFFALAAWRIARWSTTIWETGELSETLRIVFYPFSYGVSLGCFVLSLVFLTDLIRSLRPQKEIKK